MRGAEEEEDEKVAKPPTKNCSMIAIRMTSINALCNVSFSGWQFIQLVLLLLLVFVRRVPTSKHTEHKLICQCQTLKIGVFFFVYSEELRNKGLQLICRRCCYYFNYC